MWTTRVYSAFVLPLAFFSPALAGAEGTLVEAVRDKDAAAIKRLVTEEGAVSLPEADGTTALHWAVHHNDQSMVERFLQMGAPVNARNRYGVAPLSLAAENGNPAITTLLLKAGADANTQMPGGETALMAAARTGNVEAIRVLVAHGANVNAHEELRGQTALMWAASNGNGPAIAELLKAGADLSVRSFAPQRTVKSGREGGYGYTPAPPVKAKFPYGAYSPLAFAVRRGHTDAVRTLLDAGVDANEGVVARPGQGLTPMLTLAVANGHYELAAYLLDRGADPNLAENGWTALHQLARGRSEPGRTRMNLGFPPGPTMTGKMDGLAFARKWVAKGGDINARATAEYEDGYRFAGYVDRVNATPLVMAARVSDYELMQQLIDLGADATLAGNDGMTPLMCAAGNGIRIPNEDGGDDDSSTALKVILAALQQKGIDLKKAVNETDVRGWTALHGAALRGVIPVIETLINTGADLTVKTYDAGNPTRDFGMNQIGWLPVHIADGVIVSGVYIRQSEAAALLRREMTNRGIPSPPDDGLKRGGYNAAGKPKG